LGLLIGLEHVHALNLKYIFLKRAGAKALPPFQLIKEKITRVQEYEVQIIYYNYSPGIKSPKRLAPTWTQSLASALIESKITTNGESLLRKTLAFLSFQISQTTRKASEDNPFR
jgi:hypothetical protein